MPFRRSPAERQTRAGIAPALRRRLVSVGTLVLLALNASDARAAGPQDASAAREIFNAGLAAMKESDLRTACPKFAEAHRLDPNVGYVVNLARCEEKAGELVKARQHWQEARDLARKRNDPRAPEVESGFAAIDATVPRLLVKKTEPLEAGLVVRIDDVELGVASVGVAVPIDPGAHKVVARAEGYEDWTTSVTMPKGGPPATVVIPALTRRSDAVARETSQPAPTPSGPPSSEPGTANVAGASAGSTQRTLGIIGLAAGAVGLGVGAIFALRASSLDDDSKAKCAASDPNLCAPEGISLRESAASSADVATVGVIAGSLLALGGVVLYLTAPKTMRSARASLAATNASFVFGARF